MRTLFTSFVLVHSNYVTRSIGGKYCDAKQVVMASESPKAEKERSVKSVFLSKYHCLFLEVDDFASVTYVFNDERVFPVFLYS